MDFNVLGLFLEIINYTKEWEIILDAIGVCDNDKWCPELHKKHSNVDGQTSNPLIVQQIIQASLQMFVTVSLLG